MATIKQGILGGFSGKIGNIVGSSWKGIAVMKAKPLSVANPKTAAQIAQRTKFTNVVAFAKIILSVVIKPLWDRFAQAMSGYNEFVSINVSEFATGFPGTPADLVISKGKMTKTEMSAFDVTNAQPWLSVEWTDDSGEGFKLGTDIPFFVAVNETTGEIKGYDGSDNSITRATEAWAPDFDNNNSTGDTIYGYLAFRRADGTVVSNSAYKVGSFS